MKAKKPSDAAAEKGVLDSDHHHQKHDQLPHSEGPTEPNRISSTATAIIETINASVTAFQKQQHQQYNEASVDEENQDISIGSESRNKHFDKCVDGVSRRGNNRLIPRHLKKGLTTDDVEAKMKAFSALTYDVKAKMKAFSALTDDVEAKMNSFSALNVTTYNKNEDGEDQTVTKFDSRVGGIESEQGIAPQPLPLCNFENSKVFDNEVSQPGAFHVERPTSEHEDSSETSMSLGDINTIHSEPCIIAHLVTEPIEVNEESLQIVFATRFSEPIQRIRICGQSKKTLVLVFLMSFAIAVYITWDNVFARKGSQMTAKNVPTSPSTTTPANMKDFNQPILQSVKERGFLRCVPWATDMTRGKGFTIDLCRAIAAAVFNDPDGSANQIEFSDVSFQQQFLALWNRVIDVSTATTTHNMERDVHEPSTGKGMAFTIPFFYDGMKFAGRPNFVDCADRRDTLFGGCGTLSACVRSGTTTSRHVDAILPGIEKHEQDSLHVLFKLLANGTCDIIAGDSLNLGENLAREAGYLGEYKVGQKIHSNEPLTITSKGDDQEWADFCSWVVQALIKAEDLNITQDMAVSSPLWSAVTSSLENEFFETSVFGVDYRNMFRNVIAAVGNYGEIYERHYDNTDSVAPRGIRGINTIHRADSGLLYPYPFGKLMINDNVFDASLPSAIPLPRPTAGGTLEMILDRGVLRCGIIGNQIGFALLQDQEIKGEQQTDTTLQHQKIWSGLDIEYCRGIAAAIFEEELSDIDDGVVFVEVGAVEKDGYVALEEDRIDVFAGGSFSLTSDVKETTTRKGFTFSTPYFYYDTDTHANGNVGINALGIGRSLATRESDPQWSAFVRWVTIATIYAEQNGITRESALDMPVVELFGLEFKQMFRHTILKVGNYDEMFYRTLEQPYNFTRVGRNRVNIDGTPQLLPALFL